MIHKWYIILFLPVFISENTAAAFLALISPAAKPVEVIEEHCWCCEEVKFEAVTKPTAVPAAAATAAAAANGVSEDNVPSGEGDTTAINIGAKK